MMIHGDIGVIGHRCRTYPAVSTNENTVAALRDTAKVRGAWCEIDMWRLKDGTLIVWHDNTWGRVADPDTLPAGMPTKVRQATWDQVSQVRTRGGKRVPTLDRMLTVAHRLGMRVVVEIKNGLGGNAETLARYPNVWWYESPNPSSACQMRSLDELSAAGATVGVKTSGDQECRLSPKQIAQHGSFVVENSRRMIADDGELIGEYKSVGLRVIAKPVHRKRAGKLLSLGVKRMMVSRPRSAAKWTFDSRRV